MHAKYDSIIFIRNFHPHQQLRRLTIVSKFHDPMETDAFIALAEPNHRLTLSQGTNLAIATSLRIIFPTLCILILHCF